MDDNRITYFAETDARNRRVKFGIKANDRARHVYVIGKTGMGKSTLLENMAVQDIQNGSGMCFIDPHGKTADLLLEYVPQERIRDVIYIAPFDVEYPISFNVLEAVDRDKRHLVSSGLMSTFKKIWEDAWSARMEYILTNTLLALLEYPGATLLGVNRMLSDKEYRKDVVAHVQDPSVKAFWVKEFANYTERQAAEAVPAIQNKVGQFTANPLIRNMIGQAESSFNFREAMDQRKIIIINLSKGRIGDENMKLLGGLLVTKIYLAAMSRADVPDRVMKMLPNFYLFVDEFQNFANASFADILSEARKYKLNLTIAHQYIEQMDEIVRPAVFGNVGTMMTFRVGAKDAEMLEMEFAPQFTVEDLVNLGQYQMYLKLMIDGLTSPPFSATNLPPFPHPDVSYVKEIIDASREQFARPRAEVENMIVQFHNPTPPPKPVKVATPAPAAAPSPAAVPSSPAPAPRPAPAPVSQAPRPAPKPFLEKEVPPAPRPIQSSPAPQSKPVPSSAPAVAPVPKPMPKPAPQPPRASSAPHNKQPASVVQKPEPSTSVTQPSPAPIPASESAPQPVQAPPVPKPSPQATAPSFEPVRVTEKPVQLSSLAHKSPAKPDPKVPTAENVNSLKNALAAAMAKGKPEVKSQPKKETPPRPSVAAPSPAPKAPPVASPALQTPAPVPSSQGEPKPISRENSQPKPSLQEKTPLPSLAGAQTPPPEVPEDVLKNILKDE